MAQPSEGQISDPATTGLRVTVTQEPATETAQDSPSSESCLENDRTLFSWSIRSVTI